MAGRASTVTIVLASTIPAVFVLGLVVVLWRLSRRRNTHPLFNRGITPIADEEIESWKLEKHIETEAYREPSTSTNNSPRHHTHNSSVSSMQKAPSVIIYQNPLPYQTAGVPGEPSAISPQQKRSMDLPQTPVLARAPNSRPGLTDETVQGDDAFIPQLKRQPSRLSKNQHGSFSRPHHNRHRSAHTSATHDHWYGQPPELPSQERQSSDGIVPRRSTGQRSHERLYSATANRPRMSLDDTMASGGLSPRPVHKSEIGRAIG